MSNPYIIPPESGQNTIASALSQCVASNVLRVKQLRNIQYIAQGADALHICEGRQQYYRSSGEAIPHNQDGH